MGLFRPLISKGLEIAPPPGKLSDRLLTPANGMTASRPLLAVKASKMLIAGDRPVMPWLFFMGASDAEGNMARFIDKIAPNSGLGSSTKGAELDPIADTAAILIVSSAALFAPRMPRMGKAAIATALGHEGFKAAWAIRKNNAYEEVAGERLRIRPTVEGKESMFEKFSAVGMAVLASDFDNEYARNALASGALAMAAAGTNRGESQRRIYDAIADGMMEDVVAAAGWQNNDFLLQ